jgi:hypothetical protein
VIERCLRVSFYNHILLSLQEVFRVKVHDQNSSYQIHQYECKYQKPTIFGIKDIKDARSKALAPKVRSPRDASIYTKQKVSSRGIYSQNSIPLRSKDMIEVKVFSVRYDVDTGVMAIISSPVVSAS